VRPAILALLAIAAADAGASDAGTPRMISQPLSQHRYAQFEDGSAAIRTTDAWLLDAIANALRGEPNILLVEVQGYAASNERRPAKIAEARAVAVRAALVARGIAAERLEARGYAASNPLCTNKTPDCLSRNRRADFKILRRIEETRRAPVDAIYGCWTVTESGSATLLKTGQSFCLTSTAFVLRDAAGGIVDGWLVSWKPTGDGWRADVQGRDGTTLPVWFDCTLGEQGVQITGSGGFTKLKAHRDPPWTVPQAADVGTQMGASLRDCWRCLREGRELVADGTVKDLLDETFYSLRSCRGAMSAVRQAVPASRLPAICKQR